MRVGSLFSGIDGLALGLEWAGMETVFQVENDPYAIKVLEKHWPNVRRHDDVRTFPPEPIDDWRCDLICGGFPCVDISNAGKRAGIKGPQSGLWSEFARIVRILRPRYVLVENVAALVSRGLDTVLGDLAAAGYDAEWRMLSAQSVGAPHRRDRIFIVAYPNGCEQGRTRVLADAECLRQLQPQGGEPDERGRAGDRRETMADTESVGWSARSGEPGDQESTRRGRGESAASSEGRGDIPDADSRKQETISRVLRWPLPDATREGWWATEPDVGRVAHGIPARVDRLRCLGNAVVPAVAYWIGRCIMAYEQTLSPSKGPGSA